MVWTGDRVVVSTMLVIVALFLVLAPLTSAQSDGTYFPYEGADSPEQPAEQQAPAEPMGSAAGSVLYRGDGTTQDVYIELGADTDERYTLEGSAPQQGPVTLEVPVNWTQNVTVVAEENVSINLWNHNDAVPDTLLSDAVSMAVERDGELLSEVPVFRVSEGTWNLTITYTTSPVFREVTCAENTIADLIPERAEIISSDLPLDTFVQKVCTMRLYHESYTPYTGVSFSVDEIAQEDVVSIYSVEQQRYLYIEDDTLVLPR